jgi:hypothetical protein
MMNPAEKAKWLEEVFEGIAWGAQRDLERSGRFPPVGIMVGEDLPDAIMPLRFETQQIKHANMVILGGIAKTQGYDAVIVVSEAWMATRPEEEKDDENRPMPSKDPNKVETLIVSMKCRDGSERLKVIPFARDAEGKVAKFEEPRKFEGATIHMGLMEAIFPQHQTSH